MIALSDIHGEFGSLSKIADMGEILLILGDLINLTDYRTGEGLTASLLGLEFSRKLVAARSSGDYREMQRIWGEKVGEDRTEFSMRQTDLIAEDYRLMAEALDGARGFAIPGNVDRPSLMKANLPESIIWADGQCFDVEGLRVGFVGGGTSTPMGSEAEVTDDEMRRKLERLGSVDVLCSHIPPAIDALRTDVVTRLSERASGPILDYLVRVQPRFHLFGDVHQPQATRWRVGKTLCFNLGYFRATKRAFRVEPDRVSQIPVSR